VKSRKGVIDMAKKQKAILYARFSPRPNASECESVEKQLEELRRYCMENGFRIAGEFDDKALSGADDDRPGMWDAIFALKPGYTLMVRSFDRLSRDAGFFLHVIKIQIERKQANLLSITEQGASVDTAEGRMLRGFMAVLSEYNREIIRARTRSAMRRHQRNGRRMSKETPYGWKDDPNNPPRIDKDGNKVPQMMLVNEEERAVIEIVVVYFKKGMGMREISRMLVQKGVKSRGGCKWHHNQVRRMLEREGYPAGYKFSELKEKE